MQQNQRSIEELLKKLDELSRKQASLQSDLESLRKNVLDFSQEEETSVPDVEFKAPKHEIPDVPITINPIAPPAGDPVDVSQQNLKSYVPPPSVKVVRDNSNVERFIGENLISKIGIAITILGVAFGAKYAFDHDLIGPAMRVLIGYALGTGLLFVAYRLRHKYEGYSAVLTGGAMAIFYLVSFAAYSYYHFYPQGFAFLVMGLITAATVYIAMRFDKQVLAQIGMVGAYSVPFLLSDNSGRVIILFSYIAVINVGILIIAFLKSWKFLFYSSFFITWLIFGAWMIASRRQDQVALGMFFLVVFYLVFFITFMTSSLLRRQKTGTFDIIIIILNTWLFYWCGMDVIGSLASCHYCKGIFALIVAAICSVFCVVSSERNQADYSLQGTLFTMATVFLMFSVPSFFDAQWTTIAIAFIAGVYFYAGRVMGHRFFEGFSYPIMLIAVLSLGADWSISNNYFSGRQEYRYGTIFFNLTFFASLFVSTIMFGIWRIRSSAEYLNESPRKSMAVLIEKGVPFLLLVLLYGTFRVEISGIWVEKYQFDRVYDAVLGNQFYKRNESLWVLIYSMFFFSLLSWINTRKIRSTQFGILVLVCAILTLLTFLTAGLYALSYLREEEALNVHHAVIGVNVLRYGSFLFVGLLLISTWFHVRETFFKPVVKVLFDCLMHLSILWLATSELFRILDVYHSAQTYKLGLTILWGIYALFMIVGGIWKRMKHLRIMGMVIFGITIVKLLVYDLDRLSTIAKAGLFILIGLFLLLVSYLYLRFKKKIFGDEPGNEI